MSVGKIYFAWVEPNEAFSPITHAREDEAVFSISISEEEGSFAVATVEIRNPRRGLLLPARKQRAFISAEIAGQVTLLFSGRAVGVPASITGETLEVEFIGRPDDHASKQASLVSMLQADPRYHQALLSEADRSDLSALLEGVAALPHWDRATGELSLAPIANDGFQPVLDVTPLEDSFEVSFGSAPADRVRVELELTWEQVSPVLSRPLEADPGAIAVGHLANLFGGRPKSLTGEDLASRWPSPGDALDGGWTVQSAYLVPDVVDKVTLDVPVTVAAPRDPSYSAPTWELDVFRTSFDGNLVISAFYRQPRRERISFEVSANLQPVVLFPDPELLSLNAEGADIASNASPLTLAGTFRAPDADGDGYVTRTLSLSVDRPALARPALAAYPAVVGGVLQAAVARAEARLRKAARCVTATFDLPFAEAVPLSTASVVRLYDDRIPGGVMTGKVTALELVVTGDGECYATVEIGASVGRSPAAAGAYVSVPAYDAPPEPGVVTYCRNVGPDNGSRTFTRARVRNDAAAQEALVRGLDLGAEAGKFSSYGYRWAQNVDDAAAREVVERALQEAPTELDLEPVSLEATDETVVEVTALVSGPIGIVRDIDLEWEGQA